MPARMACRKVPLVLVFLMFALYLHPGFAQQDSIFDQGVWRKFIVHLPAGYQAANEYPLVLNFHGYSSNALLEELYTGFDQISDQYGFIVAYPDGINNQWDLLTNSDVDFVSHLVDTLRTRYSCNSCLFSTGMSEGGFLTYKLACSLSQPLTAIAVVAGNMPVSFQNTCAVNNGLPVLHFHGTADAVVSFNGMPPLIPPVDSTILWWVNKNNCATSPVSVLIPDNNIADSSTVIFYNYSGGTGGSIVSLYKVINGGHTWPGAIPVPSLGNTNEDIRASELIGGFFQSFCVNTSSTGKTPDTGIRLTPSPVRDILSIQSAVTIVQVSVLSLNGNELLRKSMADRNVIISLEDLPPGIFVAEILRSDGSLFTKKIVKI